MSGRLVHIDSVKWGPYDVNALRFFIMMLELHVCMDWTSVRSFNAPSFQTLPGWTGMAWAFPGLTLHMHVIFQALYLAV